MPDMRSSTVGERTKNPPRADATRGLHRSRRLRLDTTITSRQRPTIVSRSVARIVQRIVHSASLRFEIDFAALFACNGVMNELDRLSMLAQTERRAPSRDWNWLYWLIPIIGFLWLALSIWIQSKDPEGYDQRQMERVRDRIDWEASGPYR